MELRGQTKIAVEFRETIDKSQGVHSLSCPMPGTTWSGSSVERLALTVTLHGQDPLRTIFSPTHNITVQRKSLKEAMATVRAEKWSGFDDFRLFWVEDRDDLGLRVLAYQGQDKEDGYFMLLGNPTGTAGAEKIMDKDVLFVLDTSGSMRGEKIEQARAAIDYCLSHLNKGDRFNIITFGTEVRSFRDEPVGQSPENLTAGREFIEEVVANGRTNISGALAKALLGKVDPGRPRIMIFLTDGAPTAGELVPEKILEQVKKSNTSGTKIFVMGVGHDVNAHLLDQLAELTDGSSEYVAPREELDAKIAALYDRLSHPVLSGVKVSFGKLTTRSVLPPKLPVLFKGSEIMLVGRYREGGQHTFSISGNLSGTPVTYECTVQLPDPKGGSTNEFLAPLWAARQIGYLLQEIRLHGENKELIEEVVRLSKQFGIVTEYTEFLTMTRGGWNYQEAVNLARSKMATARAEQAGQWAVNQAFNDRALQNRSVASGETNQYRDRRGQVMAAQNISQIGRRAFYLQNGQWVDAEEVGKRKTRIVKLFSKEYFELLRSDPTFSRAQQLGWPLSINVGEERIVVEKDGKQQDESLRVKPPTEGDEENGQFNRFQQIPQNKFPVRNRGIGPQDPGNQNQQLLPRPR